MNQVIIVGHPSSGLTTVESLLLRCGMKPALPSRREKMLPKDIAECLCQTHPASETLTSDPSFQQIQTSGMWQEMALDLALGNAEQPLWGWSDSKSILLLDYWRTLDPQAVFLLVYEDPEQVLNATLGSEPGHLGEEDIQRLIDHWTAYNSTLLRFFLHHPDRCLLVHGGQAATCPAACIERLQERLNTRLQPPDSHPLETSLQEHAAPIPSAAVDATSLTEVLRDALTLTGCVTTSETDVFHNGVLERYVVDCYLGGQPARRLYDELQAAATLPRSDGNVAPVTARMACTALTTQRQLITHTLRQLNDQLASLQHSNAEAAANQELMHLQLHQAQEELERCVLNNLRLKNETIRAQSSKKAPPPKPALLGAGERVKQQLSYRLGKTMIAKSNSLGGWITMPFALVGEARSFRLQQKSRGKEKLPPIHEYDDAHKAERIRQQLSYRLGNAVVRNTRSPLGWIILPFALVHETIDFKRNHRQRKD